MVNRRRLPPYFGRYVDIEDSPGIRRIPSCFVRKTSSCGKYIGASTSCFIACPSTEDLKVLIDLISEKLTKLGIEPVVAVKSRAYGQDIFCTKICGKIIEAQFCIAILDDYQTKAGSKEMVIPNPNVYYEYGLMTALSKYVIPLQKEGQDLAFNIKTHDTIKYTPTNISSEIDRALDEAIRTTNKERASSGGLPLEQQYHSYLALQGFHKQGYSWLFSDDVEGTIFSGYRSDTTGQYLFFTDVDERESLQTAIMDTQIIERRLNADITMWEARIKSQSERLVELKRQQRAEKERQSVISSYGLASSITEITNKIEEDKRKLNAGRSCIFGIVLSSEVIQLKEKCVSELSSTNAPGTKFPIYFGDATGIKLGDINVEFKAPDL